VPIWEKKDIIQHVYSFIIFSRLPTNDHALRQGKENSKKRTVAATHQLSEPLTYFLAPKVWFQRFQRSFHNLLQNDDKNEIRDIKTKSSVSEAAV